MSKKQPQKIRIGSVVANIWDRQGEKGPRYHVTFERIYKDEKTEAWKSSDNFAVREVLELSKVADLAHTWIVTQSNSTKSED